MGGSTEIEGQLTSNQKKRKNEANTLQYRIERNKIKESEGKGNKMPPAVSPESIKKTSFLICTLLWKEKGNTYSGDS